MEINKLYGSTLGAIKSIAWGAVFVQQKRDKTAKTSNPCAE
jgi:hypothetical protein